VGLKQNTTILAQLPLRQFGGNPAGIRSMWGRTDLRNSTVGAGIATELAGIPAGHYPPSSWNMPYQAGQLSAFTYTGATFTAGPLNVAAGVNAAGDATFTFTAGPSQLELVVSAVGSSSITFSLTGNAAAVLNAAGAIAVQFTVGPATLGAESGLFGSTLLTFTATATPRATGNMEGAVTPFTELSPQNLAAAVWSAIATENNEPGTMGELLNSAGSAADPLLGIVEGTLTLRDVMRLLLAVNAGDATGLEGNTMVFKAQNGTTIRVEASYNAGDRTVTVIDPS
jgi:hypothetical protein